MKQLIEQLAETSQTIIAVTIWSCALRLRAINPVHPPVRVVVRGFMTQAELGRPSEEWHVATAMLRRQLGGGGGWWGREWCDAAVVKSLLWRSEGGILQGQAQQVCGGVGVSVGGQQVGGGGGVPEGAQQVGGGGVPEGAQQMGGGGRAPGVVQQGCGDRIADKPWELAGMWRWGGGGWGPLGDRSAHCGFWVG